MSEVMPPLFLSHFAHDFALRIFEAVKFEDKSFVDDAVVKARYHLARHPWSEYDGTYLSLYTLALVSRGKPFLLDDEGNNPSRREDLIFLLDLSLVGERNSHKLLDERGVAQLINFRQALEGFFPFDIHPKAVGIDVVPRPFDAIPWNDIPHGSVAMAFNVDLPRMPALGLDGIESEAAFMASFFSGEAWKAVTKRFNVANVEVDGRTQSL